MEKQPSYVWIIYDLWLFHKPLFQDPVIKQPWIQWISYPAGWLLLNRGAKFGWNTPATFLKLLIFRSAQWFGGSSQDL